MRIAGKTISNEVVIAVVITLSVFLIYLFANPEPRSAFDYTFRIAEAFLHGKLGLTETPPSWLNEMIPAGGEYYSAFPLGSVLCMIPFALLKSFHLVTAMPSAFIAALLAAVATLFFFLLSSKYADSLFRRTILSLFPALATWTTANLMFGGAWQLALGFALLGEAGALYFTLVNQQPILAGLCFAIAFGNRTEILLVAPVFIFLLMRKQDVPNEEAQDAQTKSRRLHLDFSREGTHKAGWFLTVPLLLGILTLAYNYVRFHSPLDFGYMRIPGVMNEPWFRHGLFSVYAISENAWQMLWAKWRVIDHRPYLVPSGWGGSIFISTPLLIMLFRIRLRDPATVIAAWIAIIILTFVLWLHGNPGGWQYSYRYAMILLPWIFLIILDNGKRRLSVLELALFVISIAINSYATYEFLWTKNVQP